MVKLKQDELLVFSKHYILLIFKTKSEINKKNLNKNERQGF